MLDALRHSGDHARQDNWCGHAPARTVAGGFAHRDEMVRSLRTISGDVVRDYPLINTASHKFLLSLYPQWHTRLLPDSKLLTESPDVVKDVLHTNSIHKVYLAGMKGIEHLRRGSIAACEFFTVEVLTWTGLWTPPPGRDLAHCPRAPGSRKQSLRAPHDSCRSSDYVF